MYYLLIFPNLKWRIVNDHRPVTHKFDYIQTWKDFIEPLNRFPDNIDEMYVKWLADQQIDVVKSNDILDNAKVHTIHLPKTVYRYCIIKDCQNQIDADKNICNQCFEFLISGQGEDNQVFKNAKELIIKQLY